jgi:alpha-glucosidase
MKNRFVWWRDGVIYQIYIRSFYDSNGDGIGDLNGIRQKLDYLVDLGVDALWLTPIFESPDVDFGYDVSDYYTIHPKFGGMQDLENLLNEAHNKGLRIILDMVLNHTSDQHKWFQQSRQSRNNPYSDWYLWRDPSTQGGSPNNWQSMTGGSGWEYVPERGQFYFHMYYPEQPGLNWRNPEVRQAMLDIFRFWLDKGVDGYRLDVVNVYFKDSLFRSNPRKFGLRPFDQQKHIHDTDQPEMMPLLHELRTILDEKPERYFVGEPFIAISPLDFFFTGNAEISARYCSQQMLHQLFCFDFLHCTWRAKKFKRAILDWDNALQGRGWPTYVLSNHDNPRPATRYCYAENDERLKLAAVMFLTLRGTPYIYYGDEIGMRDIQLSRSQIQDPVGKKYWPFYKGRDACRSPMQWTGLKNSGFSEGNPWLPVHPNYQNRNVRAQLRDPDSLINLYKKLVKLRRQHPVLINGNLSFINDLPNNVLIYQRKDKSDTAMILLNFSNHAIQTHISFLSESKWIVLLSTQPQERIINGTNHINLAAYQALILQKEN